MTGNPVNVIDHYQHMAMDEEEISHLDDADCHKPALCSDISFTSG